MQVLGLVLGKVGWDCANRVVGCLPASDMAESFSGKDRKGGLSIETVA